MSTEYKPLLNDNAPGYGAAPASGAYPPSAGPYPPQPTTTAVVSAGGAEPSAPPPPDGFWEPLPGYEAVVAMGVAPPAYTGPAAVAPQQVPLPAALQLSEADVRGALLAEVGRNCCWGSKAAKTMAIGPIRPSNAYHYKLETFCEGRSTSREYEPYFGGPVDGPQYGVAPGPWQIECQPSVMFVDSKARIEVPHTSIVKTCHHCTGSGMVMCWVCVGGGHQTCSHCGGSGHTHRTDAEGRTHRETCFRCHGSGRVHCHRCHGRGRVECNVCRAQGRLRLFVLLTVQWTNHVSDHVLERTDLPDHLITGAAGQVVFQDENYLVAPFGHFPEQDINLASQRLIPQHMQQWPLERILRQRHVVRSVPVSEADFSFKDKRGRFWVYGLDRQVWAPEYPHKCCCGCTVM
eukprot:m.306463 g.306463  ORF g.306463 m.306463 type:complete len:404 (-) comp55306_c1_seq5:13-1224(-)